MPPLALEMEPRRRRSSSRTGAAEAPPSRSRRDEAPAEGGRRGRRRPEPAAEASAPDQPVESRVAEPAAEQRPQPDYETPPPRAAEATSGRRRPREDRPREDRPREDRPRDDRHRDDRSRRNRDDGSRRRRGRIDELGIGEMLHADDVVGFGDHMPDFMAREVPEILTRPGGGAAEEE